MKSKLWIAGVLALTGLFVSGCAVTDIHGHQSMAASARWAQLPIANYAEAPQVGQRAGAILATLLHKKGIKSLDTAPTDQDSGGLPTMDPQHDYRQALKWARSNGYQYGVTGSVEEWQYKTGLDGEPAVGLSLRVVDVNSGETIWSASGSKAGWGYATLSGTAQKLMSNLVSHMPIKR